MAIDIQQLITAAVLNSTPSYLLVILETDEIKKRILKGTLMQIKCDKRYIINKLGRIDRLQISEFKIFDFFRIWIDLK